MVLISLMCLLVLIKVIIIAYVAGGKSVGTIFARMADKKMSNEDEVEDEVDDKKCLVHQVYNKEMDRCDDDNCHVL